MPPARRPALLLVAIGVVLAGMAGLVAWLYRGPEPGCEVVGGGRTVRLSPAQAAAISTASATPVRQRRADSAIARSIRAAGASLPDGAISQADALALAGALAGRAEAALTCQFSPASVPAEMPNGSGLTGRAERVRGELSAAFGQIQVGGFSPNGVDSGHMPGSAHYDGRAIDVFVRPVGPGQPAPRVGDRTLGGRARRRAGHRDRHLRRPDLVGTRSDNGWRDYDPPGGPTDNAILRHLDHVHIDVLRGG
ncbi:MAG: hypothetical protein L0Y54_01000 [Sporichthyaceae bacterium]|nr:hypothetical protein [Sporichthyaceae bacterium]